MEAGRLNNSEYSNSMYTKVTNVKKEIPKNNDMSNADKLKAMTLAKVGWEDILREAKDMYKRYKSTYKSLWSKSHSVEK